MAGVKGRSGHIGQVGMDSQSPIRINRGPFRGEKCEGKGKDLYFETRIEMLDALQDKAKQYTPMFWNEEKKSYVIDFDSADILGT